MNRKLVIIAVLLSAITVSSSPSEALASIFSFKSMVDNTHVEASTTEDSSESSDARTISAKPKDEESQNAKPEDNKNKSSSGDASTATATNATSNGATNGNSTKGSDYKKIEAIPAPNSAEASAKSAEGKTAKDTNAGTNADDAGAQNNSLIEDISEGKIKSNHISFERAVSLMRSADANMYQNINYMPNVTKRYNDLYLTITSGTAFIENIPAPYDSYYAPMWQGIAVVGLFSESLDYVHRFEDSNWFSRVGIAATQLVSDSLAFVNFDLTSSLGYTFAVGDWAISPYGTIGVGNSTQFIYSSAIPFYGYGGDWLVLVAGGGLSVTPKDSMYSYNTNLNFGLTAGNHVAPGAFATVAWKNNFIIEPYKSPVAFIFSINLEYLNQPQYQPAANWGKDEGFVAAQMMFETLALSVRFKI